MPVQDFNAQETWTDDWSQHLAQPALQGVTILSAGVTCDVDGISAEQETVTGGGTSITFRLVTTGLGPDAFEANVVTHALLSNGDMEPRTTRFTITQT